MSVADHGLIGLSPGSGGAAASARATRRRHREQGGKRLKYARHGLAAPLLLGGLGLAPKPAQALSEIPFHVTTRDSTGACILLQGNRQSG